MARLQSAYVLIGIIVLLVHFTKSSLISAPFDNFRIECPQNAGAQRLSIRMVESQGAKRQDTVFSISCNDLNQLYPWNGVPSNIAENEREECRYSTPFDPIMDTATELSCGPREYIASIVRLYGTKIQLGCCKLRTRDEANCVVQRFGKPYGIDVRTEIENRGMLINAISIEGGYYRVRFCDLTPRSAGLIMEDAKKAAELKTSTTIQQTTTTNLPETTQEITQTSESTTDATSPKHIIKVKKPIIESEKAQNETEIEIESTTLETELTTISQSTQSPDSIEDNELESIQPSLHGTSIVADETSHKAKDVPQGLAKIADNETLTTSNIETSSSEPSTTVEETETSTAKTELSTSESTTQESTTQKSTTTSAKPKSSSKEPKPEFVVTDGKDTETMFPKMPMGDYDEEKDIAKDTNKLMKSLVEMMQATAELSKVTKELTEKSALKEKKILRDEAKINKTMEPATQSISLISPRPSKKPISDNQTKMDANKSVEVVQSDQVPLAAENRDERDNQKKLDEFIDRAPFDFSAFPHPPEKDEPVKKVAELPRYSRVQTKPTSKPNLPIATTTKEPEYLVAERLDEIPEPINLKPRRKSARVSPLRRRPTSDSPYVDEETSNSPFDVGNEEKSTGKGHKSDPGFTEETINRRDLFDQEEEGSYEHTSEGRFSLPTESRFGQRSPFEIRRAPNPHIKEAYSSLNIAEKYVAKQPEAVDIFAKPIEEEITTTQMPPSSISHKDGERYFTPVDNKPMKVPETSMFVQDEHPKKLTFLRNKQTLPVQQQLVPMTEPSTTTTEISTPIYTTTEIPSTTTISQIEEIPVEQISQKEQARYNPLNFYHTIPPHRQLIHEKVQILTFCTKDAAIRDENQMVIACGVDDEVWQPSRCPISTDCFTSPDSLYRICCPVGSARK